MSKYLKIPKTDQYLIVADNGEIFESYVSESIKEKIGSLYEFEKAIDNQDYNPYDDMFLEYNMPFIFNNENFDSMHDYELEDKVQSYISNRILNDVKEYMDKRATKIGASITEYDWYVKICFFLLSNKYINENHVINFSRWNYGIHVSNVELKQVHDDYNNEDSKTWPEQLIYYKDIYTTTPPYFDKIDSREKVINENVYALKYKKNKINNINDNKRYIAEKQAYEEHYDRVKNDLKQVLVSGHKIALAVIPSSKVGISTTLSQIVSDLSESNINIIDASNLLVRSKEKESAHQNNGDRSISKNVDTLSLGNISIEDAEALVILDDVTTSGHSFIAANYVVRTGYPDIPIMNFSYAKTVRDYYEFNKYDKGTNLWIESQNLSIEPYLFGADGLIFDVDCTLIPLISSVDIDSVKKSYNNNTSLELFKLIGELIDNGVKIAYVSNRSQYELNKIIGWIIGTIRNGIPEHKLLNKDDFDIHDGHNPGISFYEKSNLVISTAQPVSDSKYKHGSPKPSSYGIQEAVKKMGFSDKNKRIFGIGNQESDVIAYRNFNIEPVFVDWFNKETDKFHPIPKLNNTIKSISEFRNAFNETDINF